MRIYISFVILLITNLVIAQTTWKSVDEMSISNRSVNDREIIPEHYSSYALDFGRMKKYLKNAPGENYSYAANGVTLDLPMPNGVLETFVFHESSCMSPILSKKFPSIKSYRGVSLTDKTKQARVDFGPMGFHAVVYTKEGRVFIDPFFSNPDEHYISYYTRDHQFDDGTENKSLSCGVTTNHVQSEAEKNGQLEPAEYYKALKAPVTKRTYRLAVATTGEWGAIFGTVENTMARIVTGVNRLNMIFENEIAIKFELIDDNDKLVFLDGQTDPYTDPSEGLKLLGQNRQVLNSIIGSQAYDVGHVFTIRCSDVGGVANPGVICLSGKANGVSCVGNSNISAFMVDTGAHEIGHQFSGGHSWNNCPNSLAQLSANTAYEPGSGSTILSYSGACGNQNIQGNNDDYFHVGNVEQFLSFINNTATCSENIVSGNNTPEITMDIPKNLTIPIATPFELDASAIDPDGDALTYNWEQMDTGPISQLGNPMGGAPSFRSYPPSSESKRLFPRLNFITGGIGSNKEVLPLYNRNLNFRFTVRDNHPGAGITVWEDLRLRADDSAGPFRVTSQTSITFAEVGSTLDIEWDVANTDNEVIDCQEVDIYLSLDGGRNFEILLADNVPNNGLASVKLPNNLTNDGKIKVKASNNVFFQLNRSTIIIREPSAPGFFIDVENNEYDVCLPNQIEIAVNGTSFQEFDTPIELDVITALPEGASYSFSDNPIATDGSTTLLIDLTEVENTQSFTFTLEGSAENATPIQQQVTFHVTGTSFDDLELLSPSNGISGLDKTPTFEWSNTKNAENYTIEVSTSPKFGATNTVIEEFLPDTSFLPGVIFESNSFYYWRVKANNKCIEAESEIKTFGTVSLACNNYTADNLPTNISVSGLVQVDGIARVFETGTVADVNVTNIRGQHSDAFQLAATLVSPAGTEAVLFENTCFGGADFNIGFDSDSPLEFSCPLNSGNTVQPKDSDLAIFKGENIDGEWILELNDNKGGDGGQFTSFDLEICASFAIENPFIVTNEILDVPTGLSARINNSKLLVDDNDNSPEELTYTLVVNTSKGSLYLNGEALTVGDQFTQQQLNETSIRYIHEGSENETDAFTFTVIDGNGGWIGLTNFDINIDENVLSSNEDLLDQERFVIYPNPTNDMLLIRDVSNSSNQWSVQLYSLDGKLIINDRMNIEKRLSLAYLNDGIYILKIANEEGSISQRISVIR